MLLQNVLITIALLLIAHYFQSKAAVEENHKNTLSNSLHTRSKEEEKKSQKDEEEMKFIKEKLKTAAYEFMAATAAVLGVSNPVTAATVAVGTIGFAKILQDFESKSKDVWDVLEDRIDIKIGINQPSN